MLVTMGAAAPSFGGTADRGPAFGLFEAAIRRVFEDLDHDLDEQRSLFDASVDPEVKAGHAVIIAVLHRQRFELDVALEWLEQATELTAPGTWSRALALILESGVRVLVGDFDRADELLSEAEETVPSDLEYMTTLECAFDRMSAQRFAESIPAAVHSQKLSLADGHHEYWQLGKMIESLSYYYLGDDAAAEVGFREMLVRRHQPTRWEPVSGHFLGLSLARMGAMRHAAPRMEEAARVFESWPREVMRSASIIANAYLDVDLLGQARVAADTAASVTSRFAGSQHYASALMMQIRVAVATNELPTARRLLDDADALFTEHGWTGRLESVRQIRSSLDPEIAPTWLTVDDLAAEPTIVRALIFTADQSSDPASYFEIAARAVDADRLLTRELARYATVRLSLERGAIDEAVEDLFSLLEELRAHARRTDALDVRGAIHLALIDLRGLGLRFGNLGRLDVVNLIVATIEQSIFDVDLETNGLGRSIELLGELRRSIDDEAAGDIDSTELADLDLRLGELRRRRDLARAHRRPGRAIDRSMAMPANPTISFTHTGTQIHRLTMLDGENSLMPIGETEAIMSLVRRLRFAIAALGVDPSGSIAVARAAASVEAALFAGVDFTRCETVSVRPGHRLMSVPWRYLALHRERQIAIRLRTDAPDRLIDGSPRTVLAVACADDNPDASAEAASVSEQYPHASLLAGPTATPENFLAACAIHDVIHIAGYRTLLHRSSVETSIRLDGGNVTLFELGQLDVVAPTVVVATSKPNAIDMFTHEVNYAFAHSLIARGAKHVILAPIDLSPEVSVVVMPALHRHLAQGLDPADALDALRFEDDEMQRAADTLVCIEAEPASRPAR